MSFSQSIDDVISSQFDRIASLMIKDKEFLIGTSVGGGRIGIIKKTLDSLLVISYAAGTNDDISDAFFVLVNKDELFPKAMNPKLFKRTVDSLYIDIKQMHSYKPYSKEILNNTSNFYLIFCELNKRQIFSTEEATQSQKAMVDFIMNRIYLYSLIPFNGRGRRVEYLDSKNFNELLKYLSSGTVDNRLK